MRILTFTTLFPNEQQPTHGLFVRERILALAQLVDLRVVAPVPWFPRTRMLGERYYRYAIVPPQEMHSGTLVDHPRFLVIPRFGKALDGVLLATATLSHVRKLRKAFPIDLIDAHWAYPDGVAAAILAKRLRVPFVITVRGDDINVFLETFGRRFWIRWALSSADRIIALSQELKDKVVAAGVAAERVAVIPNGINTDAFYPIDRAQARARLGLPAEGRIVLSVGRLHESKGFPLLVEAVGRLRHKFPDLQIYIVGAPDHEADARPAIREAAARYNIERRVHLVGPQDPALLKFWYNAANVFCLPTSREGSANVLIEAMACGVPCISTPVGGNAGIVNSEKVGILAPADIDSMTRALDASLSRRWDNEAISKHVRQRTWHIVAQECREQLTAVLTLALQNATSTCKNEGVSSG